MKRILFVCLFAFLAAPAAFAQIDPYRLMAEWGGIHVNRGEVTSLNVSVGDSCAVKAQVELELYDKTGAVVYRSTATVASGQVFTFGIGEADYSARNGVVTDAFFVLPTNLHLVIPCITIAFPPGPCVPAGQVTLTAEKHDSVSGRSIVFANNPHVVPVSVVSTAAAR